MTSPSAGYGAIELSHFSHRYWVAGLGLSAAIHLCLVGGYWLKVNSPPALGPVGRPWEPRVPVWVSFPEPLPPRLPGIRTPGKAQGPVVPVQLGTPLPVADPPVRPEQTIPTQEELRNLVDPAGRAGREIAGIPNSPAEEPQAPFRVVEELPAVIKRVEPEYPALAILAGIEGRVSVRILIGTDGRVKHAEIQSSDNSIFDASALDAARQFVFVPAYNIAGSVAVRTTILFRFVLK